MSQGAQGKGSTPHHNYDHLHWNVSVEASFTLRQVLPAAARDPPNLGRGGNGGACRAAGVYAGTLQQRLSPCAKRLEKRAIQTTWCYKSGGCSRQRRSLATYCKQGTHWFNKCEGRARQLTPVYFATAPLSPLRTRTTTGII